MIRRNLLAVRLAGAGTTVFSEFSALAAAHGAVNLGQGFPDFDGPEEIKEAAARAIRDGINQYAISAGAVALRESIAHHASRFYGLTVDPRTMITVTSGATEAIFDAILGLVDPGDEVILFEPFYDSYSMSVQLAGGTARHVPLRPPDAGHRTWWFDPAELEAAFAWNTKLLVLNSPHNPTGKVFTSDELSLIAELCERHDVVVLSDEVYEHIVFSPARHVPIATLPGMFDRTITIGSAGKTFSFTGWKIGWAIAPPRLREAVQQTHQFITFATASPLQAAIAEALRMPDGFFEQLKRDYVRRRDRLMGVLETARLRPIAPQGSYFIMSDISELGFEDDFAFCRWLTTTVGVAAIPPSAFYSAAHRSLGQGLARFAFCKTDSALDLAAARLREAFAGRAKG